MLRRSTRQPIYWATLSSPEKHDRLGCSDSEEDPSSTPRRRIRLHRTNPISRGDTRISSRRIVLVMLFLIVCLCAGIWGLRHLTETGIVVPVASPQAIRGFSKKQQGKSKMPTGRRPVVDRKVFVDLVDEEPQHEFDGVSTEKVNVHWPPLVTAIPEIHPAPGVTHIGLTSSSVDAQFCRGASRCRFILPLWIGEQESRGRIHLTQILHLAAALNRTVVLPNVGKSRIGICGRWGFEAYYDVGSYARHLKDIGGESSQVMLMDDFRTWINMRPEEPISQLVFLDERQGADVSSPQSTLVSADDSLELYIDNDTLKDHDTRLKNAFCLKTKYKHLHLDRRPPLSLHANISDATPLLSAGANFSALFGRDDLIQPSALRQHYDSDGISPPQEPAATGENEEAPSPSSVPPPTLQEPDVLVLQWDLRHLPFLSAPTTTGLGYSQRLWELANLLTVPSGVYLAVHWRMETVQSDLLPDCAEALVDTLSMLLADPTLGKGITTIWMATDMPGMMARPTDDTGYGVLGPSQRSNTFKEITREHVDAMDIVRTAFDAGGPLSEWRLTGLTEEMHRVRDEMLRTRHEFTLDGEDDDGLLWEDPGIWGILDKIVAMQAALFVSGARGCGKVSSFTRQIVDHRTEVQGNNLPRNVVELFG